MTDQPTKKRGKTGWIWFASVIVAVVGLGPLLIQDRTGTYRLLATAQRRGLGTLSYQWLDDREILYAEMWRKAKPHNRLVKRNVDQGIISAIRPFESKQRNFGFGEMNSVLSPDKKTLIWIGSSYLFLPLGTTQQVPFPHAMSQSLNGKTAYIPSVAWLPDSKGWAEIQGPIGASALIVHPPGGANPITAPLPPGLGIQQILGVTPKNE